MTVERLYICHRCDFYCEPEYNQWSEVCPECDSKLYLIEGSPQEIDDYIKDNLK